MTSQPLTSSKYVLVTNGRELKKAISPLKGSDILGIDVETSGLDPHTDNIRLVQIAAPNLPVVIIDISLFDPKELKPLLLLLEGKALKVFHNAKFDLSFLQVSDLKPSGPFFDTQIASQLISAGLKKSHSLKAVAQRYLGVELDKSEQKSQFINHQLTESQLTYAATDAAILLELYPILSHKLKVAKLTTVASFEAAALPAVAQMELNGMLLDTKRMSAILTELEAKKQEYLKTLQAVLKPTVKQLSLFPEITDVVNLESPAQVLSALKNIGIALASTSRAALIPLQSKHPIIKTLLEYRKCSKLICTFVEGLPTHINPVTGRIHPSYLQCGARSGRFSCRNPNLQNIPRDKNIRSCFIASPGYAIIRADYSQIELRIAAFLSGDRRMKQAYLNGEDLHSLTASLIIGKPLDAIAKEDRQLAKPINFGLVYGMGATKLKIYAEIEFGVIITLKQARLFSQRFFQAYPGLKRWHQKIKNTIHATYKREIRTIAGRRRRWQTNPSLSELYNHPVQGSSADFLKIALGHLHLALTNTGALLIGTVHDEILLECPLEQVERTQDILRQCMLEPAQIALHPIPVEVEIKVGNSWGT